MSLEYLQSWAEIMPEEIKIDLDQNCFYINESVNFTLCCNLDLSSYDDSKTLYLYITKKIKQKDCGFRALPNNNFAIYKGSTTYRTNFPQGNLDFSKSMLICYNQMLKERTEQEISDFKRTQKEVMSPFFKLACI